MTNQIKLGVKSNIFIEKFVILISIFYTCIFQYFFGIMYFSQLIV